MLLLAYSYTYAHACPCRPRYISPFSPQQDCRSTSASNRQGSIKEKQRSAMDCLPVWFLFFLRLLPQRHCSICDPLLKMFQRNHIDLGEKQSSSLYTLRKKRSLWLHNNKLRPVLLKRGTSFIIEKMIIFRSSPSFFFFFPHVVYFFETFQWMLFSARLNGYSP